MGAVGDDDFGTNLLDRLTADGLDVTYCPRLPDRATGVAFVTYFSDGSRRFLFHIAHAAAGQITNPPAEYFRGEKFLHICGSSLSVSERMREAAITPASRWWRAAARSASTPTSGRSCWVEKRPCGASARRCWTVRPWSCPAARRRNC